jgi:hypothetical protein
MADHSVTVDHSATPSQIEYSPVFNTLTHGVPVSIQVESK